MPPDLTSPEVKEEGNLLIEAVSLLVQRQRETETWVAEQVWQAEERAAATERRYADLEARLAGIEENLTRLTSDVAPHADPVVDERLARLREQVDGLKSVGEARPAWPAPDAPLSEGPTPPASSAPAYAAPASESPASGVPPYGVPTSGAPPYGVPTPGAAPYGGPVPGASPYGVPASAAAAPVGEPVSAHRPTPAVPAPSGPPPASAYAVAPASAPPPPPRATQTSGGFLDMLGPTPQDRFGFLLIGAGAIAILYTLLTQVHLS